jgi:TolB protein
MDADGANVVQRTKNGKYNSQPAWSPDGKKIAFAGSHPIPNSQELFGQDVYSQDVLVVSADEDGTNPISITHEQGFDAYPAWSPDGTKIAFSSDWVAYDFAMDLFVVSPDGSGRTQMTFGVGPNSIREHHQPAWSPDGRTFAVVTCLIASVVCSSSAIAVQSALPWTSGGRHAPLTVLASTFGFARPTWSPDGRMIAFSSGGFIQWITADGSARGVIIGNGLSPSWRR